MDIKKDIRVIINQNAKKFRTGKSSIDEYRKLESEFISIVTPSSLDELRSETAKMALEKPGYICIAGGDGTLHVVLSSIINSYLPEPVPPILILKEGTMDNVARTVSLKGRGPQLLKRLASSVAGGHSIEIHQRDTLKIGDNYCFLFGTGFVTNFLREAYSGREKGVLRNLQVAFLAMKEAFSNKQSGRIFSEMSGDIFIDNVKVSIDPVQGILAGTVEHIGMGFSPLPDSVKATGEFQVIILGMNPSSVILKLNSLRTGKKIRSDKYYNITAARLQLKYPGSFDYTMDGDLYQARRELIVETGPVINLVKV